MSALHDTTDMVVQILAEGLDGIPVSTELPYEASMPQGSPQRYVTVTLEGDQSTEFLLQPTYSLTCWGRTDREAKGIALDAIDALRDASCTHPYLSACRLQSLSRDGWGKAAPRYLAMVELTINTY